VTTDEAPQSESDRAHGGAPTGWRIVFFGTPEFAVPSLRALVQAGERVVGVVTQPDKPAGRGQKPTPPPVKLVAQELQLPVLQPSKVRDNPELFAALRAWRPDVIVVAAYGKILPREILEIPPHGCINVHASLLPKYRGAAPIQWALLNGEQVTGITIMLMSEEMDAGPVLLQRSVFIEPEETCGELQARLAREGAECLVEALRAWHAGRLTPQPQDSSQVTFAPALRKEQALIDWNQSADAISRIVRAFAPNPGAFFLWQGKRVKVYRARALEDAGSEGTLPGTVLEVEPRLVVACRVGALELIEVQLEGRRKSAGSAFARGVRWRPGDRLV
jgi:methionyl-tRNA formyltransferase